MYLDGRHKPVFISCLSTNTDTEVKAYQINRHQLSLPVLLRGTESSAVSGCCKSPPSSVTALEVRTRCWWNHMHTMTSSNGNIFRVTDPLCGEFTGHRWIPRTKGQWRGALMFSLICAWINGWVNNRDWWSHTPSRPLWCHCNNGSIRYLAPGGRFYQHVLTLIPARMSYYSHYLVLDEITYPFPNFNGATVEVWEWISNSEGASEGYAKFNGQWLL